MSQYREDLKIIWQGLQTSFSRKIFPRPLRLFHIDMGGCGGCTMALGCLGHYPYNEDLGGFCLTRDPMVADALLLSGALCRAMIPYIRQIWAQIPEPKGAIAVGQCTTDQTIFPENYAVLGDINRLTPIDLTIAGCPPSPTDIIKGLRALLGKD